MTLVPEAKRILVQSEQAKQYMTCIQMVGTVYHRPSFLKFTERR